jgi:hypothetical protein
MRQSAMTPAPKLEYNSHCDMHISMTSVCLVGEIANRNFLRVCECSNSKPAMLKGSIFISIKTTGYGSRSDTEG